MEKIELYQYRNEQDEIVVTTEPKPLTSAQLFYMLIADEKCYLYNKKINSNRRSVITPFYLVNDWEEIRQKEGNE